MTAPADGELPSSVPLHEATRTRYLSYALSVITSRALPDVRDGLKPVQRRILYAMFAEMGLHPSARYRKCAAVVGDVMGKFHPHGDVSIYDALVRMSQPFALRAPLVDGQGNFGSLDGDPPAAMRYTECRLTPLAEELLLEIRKNTVAFRPNYDGQRSEPVVLPAQFPQLLVNGCEGIAVGMATRIPPHSLGEVVDATVAVIDDPGISIAGLMKFLPGPDFPTGARILSSPAEILDIYETGQGTLRVCATWREEKAGRTRLVIVDSVPYGQNKAKLIERIGEEVRLKRLPQVTDVRDESTDIVRIVLELKAGAAPEEVMAYLYKRTPLQTTWPVNLTALVPMERGDVGTPARLDLKTILELWLKFRVETVRKRYEFDLAELRERIHILEGFAIVFGMLDEAIRIIRASEGRRDATDQLMARFGLSEPQTDAILDLRLYRLARLEIQLINEELAQKRAEATGIERILGNEKELRGRVRSELVALRNLYGEPRRTILGAPEVELAFDANAYVVREDTYVVVTRDGWIKRQSSFSDLSRIRVRDGDQVGWLVKCSTASNIAFFGSGGGAWVIRADGIPASTGYGDPLTRHFALPDGEKIVGVVSHDPRHRLPTEPPPQLVEGDEPPPPGPYGIAFTSGGRALRFPLSAHEEASTRNGRRYCRLDESDSVFAVYPCTGTEIVSVASRLGSAMAYPVSEIAVLRAPGKGVIGIKLRDEDTLFAFQLARTPEEGAEIVTSFGKTVRVSRAAYPSGGQGQRGHALLKRGSIESWRDRGPVVLLGPDVPNTPLDARNSPGEDGK